MIYSRQLKFPNYLRRDHILVAPTIYDQTVDFVFDGACRVKDIATPPILITITLGCQQMFFDHKGCIAISIQNITIADRIILVISKIHEFFFY